MLNAIKSDRAPKFSLLGRSVKKRVIRQALLLFLPLCSILFIGSYLIYKADLSRMVLPLKLEPFRS